MINPPQTHEATKPVITQTNPVSLTEKDETKSEPLKISATENVITNNIIKDEKPKQKSSSGFLAFICFLLLIVVGWFVYKDYFKEKFKPQPKAVMPPLQKSINADEQKLKDSIQQQKNVYLSRIVNVQPLVFNDSVFVDKDSLHIHGNGSTIVSDSSYKNAAFIFSSNCKYVLIDSLTLQGFGVGIIANNNVLHLKDVQFKNCNVAVQHEIISNDKTVSGKFTDSLSSTKKDSVKTKH